MGDYIDVEFHFGGRLELNPTPTYIGGKTHVFEDADCDKFAIGVFVNSAKLLEVTDVECFWYKFPSDNLLKPIKGDSDVHDILNSVRLGMINPHAKLEIYVVHKNEVQEELDVYCLDDIETNSVRETSSQDDTDFTRPPMDCDSEATVLFVEDEGVQTEDLIGLNDFENPEDKDDLDCEDNESEYGDNNELISISSDDENSGQPHYKEFHQDEDDPLMDCVLRLGMVYGDHLQFKRALMNYATARRFDYVFLKNESTRVTAVCKRLCGWRIHASLTQDRVSFQVKSFKSDHVRCNFHTVNSEVTARWLACKYLANFKDDPDWDLAALQGQVKRDYNATVTIYKFERAKRLALGTIDGDVPQYEQLLSHSAALFTPIGTRNSLGGKQHICSFCLVAGHNIRSCKAAPTNPSRKPMRKKKGGNSAPGSRQTETGEASTQIRKRN